MRLSAARAVSVATAIAFVALFILPASHADAAGEVSITKVVNNVRATSAPGPSVTTGTTVRFRYVVTVSSPEPLYDFIVTDTNGLSPDCDLDGDTKPDGYNGHPGPLANGSQFVCFASERAGEPGLVIASIGRVKAYNFDVTESFEADDVSHYTAVAPVTTSSKPTSTAAPSSTVADTSSTSTQRQLTTASTATTAKAETTATTADQTTTPSTGSTQVQSVSEQQSTQATATDGSDTTGGATTGTNSASSSDSSSTGATDRPQEADGTQTSDSVTAVDPLGEGSSETDEGDEGVDSALGQPPSTLAFADEFEFSYLLAVLAAAAGTTFALTRHYAGIRRRDSAPGQARG